MVRKIDNKELLDEYISNDLIFLQNETQETEKIAVAFVKKNANVRHDNLEK